MGDVDYDAKFKEMQKYIPFLERVIEKLKNSDQDKPRKAQLDKMQTLHNLLHNKEKKLKIETLLKCETVLKKLHAKIEKSDDIIPPKAPYNLTNPNISSSATIKVHIPTCSPTTNSKNKFVPNHRNKNLIDIHTCPASPPHLGEEDFRPPVEIPTERRSSPIKLVPTSPWEQTNSLNDTLDQQTRKNMVNSGREFPNRFMDVYHSGNSNNHHKYDTLPKHSRNWPDPRDRNRDVPPASPSSPSSFNRTRCSTSTSFLSNNQRSHKRDSNFSSGEENWDEPEEEFIRKPRPDLKPIPSTLPSSSYSSHKASRSAQHQRYNDRTNFHFQTDLAPSPRSPLPDFANPIDPNHGKDYQSKIFHDTIYKYKKSEAYNSFMNPSAPEPRMQKHSPGSVFNRLSDKIDGFENFQIHVKNDKAKDRPHHKAVKPPEPPALLVSTKPLGDVLKSPPLSADDIDDLLNESLEAAMEKQKTTKQADGPNDPKTNSLDAVRKKLALLSKPSSPAGIESPSRLENKVEEPFSRRAHTPTLTSCVKPKHLDEDISHPTPPTKNLPLPSPQSPPNAMDVVVERLALKYHPHKRRESVSVERNYQSQADRTNAPVLSGNDSINPFRSKQSSHREGMLPSSHVVDPRMNKKSSTAIPPLMSLPVTPVPNVLPTINHFDPRLRNTNPLKKDQNVPFTVPKPYHPAIPSLLDIQVHIPAIVPAPTLPTYNMNSPKIAPVILDPKSPKPQRPPQNQQKTYVDKFNPERNDKTERMKYLESKRNKPPEPKTYGEYKQSKNRQKQQEENRAAPHTNEEIASPNTSAIQPIVPSTLDKMYRNADYAKDISGSIQGFKIPKKPKPETPKATEVKSPEPKPGEESKNDPPPANVDQNVKTVEDSSKKKESDQMESVKKTKDPQKSDDDQVKPKENTTEKVSKQNEAVTKTANDKETKTEALPQSKKKKMKAKRGSTSENASVEPKVVTPAESIEPKAQSPEPDSKSCEDSNALQESLPDAGLIVEDSETAKLDAAIVEEVVEKAPETKTFRSKRLQSKKKPTKDNDRKSEPETKELTEKETPDNIDKGEEEQIETKTEEPKPRRICSRRSTVVLKEPKVLAEEIDVKETETSDETQPRPRSAADIFSPTTDNSVVSTQNIISGKRRTRVSMNFSEKTVRKPPTPKAVASTITPSPKIRTPKGRFAKGSGTKQAATKSDTDEQQKEEIVVQKNSEDGQICAVSSTTEGPHNEPEIVNVTPASSEEPSSSNADDQMQTPNKIVDPENQKKHEFLEGFLMSMTDPTANKERILEMLKSVLDETKLQQVKEILYSPEKSAKESDKKHETEGEEEEEEHHEQNKPRITRTKKNELDRLNEDIRDMFICQGVVTATGRRMCTVAKETSKKSPEQPKKKKVVPAKSTKSPPATTQSSSSLNKRRMRKAKVILSPINIRSLRSRNHNTKQTPKMPVLQPNTPITIPGEENLKKPKEVNKTSNKKPGPKSKRPPTDESDTTDTSDDDIELVFLKKKMKIKAEQHKEKSVDKTSEEEEVKIASTEEKPQPKSEDQVETKVKANDKDNKSIKVCDDKSKDEPETVPKNTNPDFHTKSDNSNCCVICKEKTRFIAPHYLIAHNDSEVYTSRLPPEVLEETKLNINNHALFSIPKKHMTAFNYTCLFCDFQATITLRAWMEHFTIHTGEYAHKCSKCFKGMNGSSHMMEHIKSNCPDARKINRNPVNLRGNGIVGYVCHLCNFIQMLRGGVIQHLKVHHELDDAESIARIVEIKLIDTSTVVKKEENKLQSSASEASTAVAPTCKPSESNRPKAIKDCATKTLSSELKPNETNIVNEESNDSNSEGFLPQDRESPITIDLTEQTDLDLDVTTSLSSNVNVANNSVNDPKVINLNIEVFLPPRDLASPTSLGLTERLKSIEKDDMTANKSTPEAKKMTIAERLSQRFKNIEKQNATEEDSRSEKNDNETRDKENQPATPSKVIEVEKPAVSSPDSSFSLNESGNLVIDEQVQNDSLNKDKQGGSESEEEIENDDEDDNDNWEDIEITETTKSGSQKDKNKNKSIFQTLSRLYASIAPKKSSKKFKEKEKDKKKAADTSEKPIAAKPVVEENVDPLLLPEPTQLVPIQVEPQQQRLPNLSEFLPDSPGDSLDMLLTSNFGCLEGDGSSFPHLDLNDLHSSIFPLPEEQENIQDAIAMATDMDQMKYDVLGNLIPSNVKSQQNPISFNPSSTVQKIGNYGFSLNGNMLKYYCMVKSCTFLYSDHPDGLQNHFLLDHPNLKWNGYCEACKMQVDFGDNCREMKHMLDVHSRPRTEDSGDKPRIKFRRLTGDILSTDKQKVDIPPADQFPTIDNVMSLNSPSHLTSTPFETFNVELPNDSVSTSTEFIVNSEQSQSPAPLNNQPSQNHNLCLSTLLQSEPRAMIPPKAPPQLNMDIPLFKNISKEFTITNVAEGVTDNDLMNLMFKTADSAPGGIQISQVMSLSAGGNTASPIAFNQLADILTSTEQRHSPSPKQIPSSTPSVPSMINKDNHPARSSPKPYPNAFPRTQVNSPVMPKSPNTNQLPYGCCAKNCSFTTNNRAVMSDHILTHIRCDNNREALKCNVCRFMSQDVNHYFNHMAQVHSRQDVIAKPCATTVDLTQKIQDILRTTSTPNPTDEKEEQISQTQTPATPISVQEQLPMKSKEQPKEDIDMSFQQKLRKTAEEIVAPTGLSYEEIWKCIFYPNCQVPVTESDFQTHLSTHTNVVPTSFPSISPGSSLHCPHCPANYYRAAVLKAHMKTHARHHFFCIACSCTTFGSFQHAQKHLSDMHSFTGVLRTQILFPEAAKNSNFVLVSAKEIDSNSLIQFGEKLILDWERQKALNKTHFKPNEQNLLPLQPIFPNQVYCSVCNYKTKVRTNMFRHLQLHNQDVDVGSVDPVNPVPCLEKNEKHFDKMLNLACSSNTGSSMKPKESVKIPVFVPDMRRYVCGHPGCKYLTITDQMLRSHLNALHGHEKGYTCPHCQEEICKKNMCAERVVQHLKFHGNKIYQCSECEYFHYTKHVVERHINEKHVSVSVVNLVSYERSDTENKKSTQQITGRNVTPSQTTNNDSESTGEPSASMSTPPNTKMKWECALCKHQTATWNQMISHANSMHNAKHQYHCVHCSFGSAHLAHIMEHIDSKHPSKIREAKYVFYKINETPQDKAADTRPLWSRNDPKRVRSIRGILMENEEDAERTKKSLTRAGLDIDEDDEEVTSGATDLHSSFMSGGLACFHCNYTCLEINSLSQHWRLKHWHEKNGEMVPKVPFFFRLQTVLKCPSCTYVGDPNSLKLHLINSHGQRNFCASDPNVPNTCGHCTFVYPTKRLDVLFSHYLREHKSTDAKNISSGLLKSLLTLGECQVYMQCYFCAEICADKTSIIEHERERHMSSNFRYKQIKDEVIYRCSMCQYSSTNELATLRHMIDHFEGFNICHFCKSVQSNFNSYMQHCYAIHMKSLANFKEIYTFGKICSFLKQMLLVFPNGLIAAKKNLMDTQYGNTERIKAMYDEICKKALEPPIPPLCMGRLLAKKSVEASTLLPPPHMATTAKRIAKRRSTVAMGGCDRESLSTFLVPSEPQRINKRKSSICGDFQQPSAPLFSTITTNSNNIVNDPADRTDEVDSKCSEPKGFSFYGQKPDPIDLSKVYTHIAIGDKYAPVSVKKFSLLFKINTKVVIEPVNLRDYQTIKRTASFRKPCPASKKKKFA